MLLKIERVHLESSYDHETGQQEITPGEKTIIWLNTDRIVLMQNEKWYPGFTTIELMRSTFYVTDAEAQRIIKHINGETPQQKLAAAITAVLPDLPDDAPPEIDHAADPIIL